jgi:thiol-disulfide isomerase/thioredoxin
MALLKIDIMHLNTRYLSTGLKILVKFRRNLLEGQHPILRKHMWGFFLTQLVYPSYWCWFCRQVDDVIDDVSEDEAKEKDSDDMKDSLIKTTKKAKAKTKTKTKK